MLPGWVAQGWPKLGRQPRGLDTPPRSCPLGYQVVGHKVPGLLGRVLMSWVVVQTRVLWPDCGGLAGVPYCSALAAPGSTW